MNDKILNDLSYGVYIISTMDGDRPTGCTANSIMQVTAIPADVVASMNHENFTTECIRKTKRFAVSILAEDSNPLLIGSFGFGSGRDFNKFDRFDFEYVEGLPIIKDSCGYIICELKGEAETLTHTLFIGEIVEGDVYGDRTPMTYDYYHKVIKGKSPKTAPTYRPEE